MLGIYCLCKDDKLYAFLVAIGETSTAKAN